MFDSSKNGIAWNTEKVIATAEGFPKIDGSVFDGGNAKPDVSCLKLYVETGNNVVDVSTLPLPSELGVCPGAELKIIKCDNSKGYITFTDVDSGEDLVYDHSDAKKDYVCVKAICNLTQDRWTL